MIRRFLETVFLWVRIHLVDDVSCGVNDRFESVARCSVDICWDVWDGDLGRDVWDGMFKIYHGFGSFTTLYSLAEISTMALVSLLSIPNYPTPRKTPKSLRASDIERFWGVFTPYSVLQHPSLTHHHPKSIASPISGYDTWIYPFPRSSDQQASKSGLFLPRDAGMGLLEGVYTVFIPSSDAAYLYM
jgi:hypothetical protein